MSRKVWCDDWQCPARRSCAHHFGRSHAYAAMSKCRVESVENTGQYNRASSERVGCCDQYKRDRIKRWLMPRPGQVVLPEGWPA